MFKTWWVWLLCLTTLYLYLPCIYAHSVNNRKLERIEPLNAVSLDIAPRPEAFFEKRSLTANPAYVPKSPKAIEYDDILRLSLTAYNQTFHLHLHPNTDLFHPNAVVNYGGYEERIRPQDYRVYRGLVIDSAYSDDRWKEDQAGVWRDELTAEHEPGVLGWARIIVRHDIRHDLEYPIFEGSFEVYGDIHHVKVTQNYKRVKRSDDADLQDHHQNTHMVIYRDSDTKIVQLEKRAEHNVEPASECGFDRLLYREMPSTASFGHRAAMSSYFGGISQSQLFGSIGSHSLLSKRAPEGCPTSTKINYMGAAADCTYTKYYQSATNARMQIIQDWNSASAVYQRTFNVQLGLINITIMPETCPTTASSSAPWNQGCSTSYTVSDRLSDFSRWRGSLGDDGAGLWHLMTSCASGIEVGVAWLGKLCDKEATAQTTSGQTQYVSGTGLSSIIRDEWKVVAHEIGHNFGAIHDCTSDTCPCSGSCNQCCPLSSTQCDAGGTYIMNPSSNVSTNDFSPCTIKMICDNFPNLGTCLEDPGSRTIKTLQMCGNGIKEEGEDCDPGGQNSTSNCCDPKTCKYINNAKCDDTTDLCCSNCQYRPANYTCRPALSECDVAEVCSGNSGDCPSDSFKSDGSSCGNGLYCASGQCTSRDLQCRQRGSVMNVTRACGAIDGCQLACDNPKGFGCILFNGNFLDGTPCGVGGPCKGGSCSLDNFGTNAKNWINDHLYIVIPVAAVVGLLLLCCISRCFLYGCCGYGGYRTVNKGGYVITTAPQQPYTAYPPPYTPQPYYAPPPAPPPHTGGTAPGHWVDPSRYNGTGPAQPSAAYAPGPGQVREAYEMNSPETWRSNSVSPAPRDGSNNNGNISGRVRRFEEQMGTH